MPTNTANFTKRWIESLKFAKSGKRITYRDEKSPHLELVVGTSSKVFYWYGRTHFGVKRVKIGTFPDWSVPLARDEAAEKSAAAARGEDLTGDRRGGGTTFGELFAVYLEVHAKPYKKSWAQDEYTYNRHLAHWQNKPLSDISVAMLQRLHVKIGTSSGQTTANRVRALVSTMFNVAKEHGCWAGENPVSYVKKFKENERERFLEPHEKKQFIDALNADANETFRDYVLLSLFTGARQDNVLSMRWDHIDFDRGVWVIPAEDHKSGKAQAVPLTEPALGVLKRRQNASTSPWVLDSSRSASGHLTRPGRAWKRLLGRAGLAENLTMHDLRRTLGSWQAAAGASELVIGKSLGHTSSSSTRIYARLNLDPVRESMNEAAKALAVDGE